MFEYNTIDCKVRTLPNENVNYNINRVYTIIKCTFDNTNEEYRSYIQTKALELALNVHPNRANDATNPRNRNRLIQDAIGGVLAEHGWLWYINSIYGNIASFTEFETAIGQIDIILNNGKTIEVRSSFPRNGTKFAICNDRYNFRNICKYDNFYKPEEANKDFFASVLFETSKANLLDSDEIIFYLIGGSTRAMMESNLCYTANLIAEDDITQEQTNYKVIDLKNALDISGFECYMQTMGYTKIH